MAEGHKTHAGGGVFAPAVGGNDDTPCEEEHDADQYDDQIAGKEHPQ